MPKLYIMYVYLCSAAIKYQDWPVQISTRERERFSFFLIHHCIIEMNKTPSHAWGRFAQTTFIFTFRSNWTEQNICNNQNYRFVFLLRIRLKKCFKKEYFLQPRRICFSWILGLNKLCCVQFVQLLLAILIIDLIHVSKYLPWSIKSSFAYAEQCLCIPLCV